MTLGDVIKAYRAEHNLSMDAFSEKSGISKAYISLLEKNKHPKTGKSIAPSIQCIKQAAIGMNIGFNNLFSMLDRDVSPGNDLSDNPTSSFFKKNALASRLIQIRKENGYQTRKSFALELGIPETALRNYEKNEREPNFDFLIKISEMFNISTDYLLGLTDEKEVLHTFRLHSSEQDIIEKYRTLDPHGKDIVDYVITKEAERIQELKTSQATVIDIQPYQKDLTQHIYPYLGKIACAGAGFFFDDIPTDTIEAPYVKGADFVIGVNGDSMEPDYHDGEKLYLCKMESLQIGDTGIFTIGNKCFLKELGEDGLTSRNKDYDNILGNEDIRLVGKVIGKVEI